MAPQRSTLVLSPREREALALSAEGRSDKQIAGALGCSLDTATRYVGRAMLKLGCETRMEAVQAAAGRRAGAAHPGTVVSPVRIQRRRAKGWRMPEGAVYVGRPTVWGNPWTLEPFMGGWSVDLGLAHLDVYEDQASAARRAVDEFRRYALECGPFWWQDLRGHDLACWCPLEDADGNRVPCHADVLLELANR